MKKSSFDRCLLSVSTMTSAQRYDLKVAIERREKKDLLDEVASLVGTPTSCSHCHHAEIRPRGIYSRALALPVPGMSPTPKVLTNMPFSGLHHKDQWMFTWRSSAKGNRSKSRFGGLGSTLMRPFCGDNGFCLSHLFESPTGMQHRRTR